MTKPLVIPTTVEELTATWLTQALSSSGLLGGAAVNSVTVEPLNVGLFGFNARLRLTYDSPNSAPTSLIAKLSSADPKVRAASIPFAKREVYFYKELRAEIGLNLANCYFGQLDEESEKFILLIEDLGHLRMENVAQGCTLEDTETVVAHFARYHARWWQSPILKENDLLAFNNVADPAYIQQCLDWWSRFAERASILDPDCYLPAPFIELGYQAFRHRQEIINLLASTPHTLIHNDTHIDNLMFAVSPADPPLTVIDWQLCQSGPGVRDIAYFVIISNTIRLRRQSERELLQTYHTILIEQGVTNYSIEQCWHDYRLSFFRVLDAALWGVNVFDLSTPYGKELFQVLIPRLVSFAEDHRVHEFLS